MARDGDRRGADEPSGRRQRAGPETLVAACRPAEAPAYAIAIVGELTGGRRLLSDDLATLEAIAVDRRPPHRRASASPHERYERELREQEIGKLATEAELRALRAQINPHFLFNALTTIGYLIQTAPPRALETLMRLTALLRGVLRSEGEFTTLGRELELIESYLDIERARFEQRLRVRIDVPAGAAGSFACRRCCCSRSSRTRSSTASRRSARRRGDRHGAPRRSAGDASRARAHRARHAAPAPPPRSCSRGRAVGVGLRTSSAGSPVSTATRRALVDHQRLAGAGTIVEIRLPVDVRQVPRAGRCRERSDERAPARRHRRRRAPGALVPRGAAALVRRRGRSSARRRRARRRSRLIERERPDLALLDLQMPELDGIGVVRMLKKQRLPLIAFVTAYDEYAVRAFEVNAVDYLLKPVEKARLREALNRAQERIEHAEIVAEQALARRRRDRRLRIVARVRRTSSASRSGSATRSCIVPVAQIASIVAEGELLHLTTIKNERHTITYRLEGSRAAARSGAVHPARPRHAGQHRPDRRRSA